MTENVIYVPFPSKLYADIIRFSDGKLDPALIAEGLVHTYVSNSIDCADAAWGDRLEEAAEEYAPQALERWRREDETASEDRRVENKPLVWKEITVLAGSEVRMSYGGDQHYAVVRGGRIFDDGKMYSPSEWTSKIASNTSRSAWRDLWFKAPHSKTWVPAQVLRNQAIEERRRVNSASDENYS